MSILRCLYCDCELEIVDGFRAVSKKVKCKGCGFTNFEIKNKMPEVIVIKKRI